MLSDIGKISYHTIAGKYGISVALVAKIRKEQDHIRSMTYHCLNLTRKRNRLGKSHELDEKVFEFIQWMQNERLPAPR